MTHADLAREIHFRGMKKDRLAEVATYNPGKTWRDFHAACETGKRLGSGMEVSERIGCITRLIQSVVRMK